MKIFNTKTKNFTNSGLFPSSMLYPSTMLFPQHVDFNGDFSQGDEVVNPISCVEVKSKDEWYIEVELPLEYVSLIEQDTFLVVETKEKLSEFLDIMFTKDFACLDIADIDMSNFFSVPK